MHCARGVQLLSKYGGEEAREALLVRANRGLRGLLPEEAELAWLLKDKEELVR